MASITYLVFAPTIYIILASLGLLQFGILFSMLAHAAEEAGRLPALEALAPVVRSYVRFLEGSFGPAYKYSPDATQITLVALMLAMIVELGRGR